MLGPRYKFVLRNRFPFCSALGLLIKHSRLLYLFISFLGLCMTFKSIELWTISICSYAQIFEHTKEMLGVSFIKYNVVLCNEIEFGKWEPKNLLPFMCLLRSQCWTHQRTLNTHFVFSLWCVAVCVLLDRVCRMCLVYKGGKEIRKGKVLPIIQNKKRNHFPLLEN